MIRHTFTADLFCMHAEIQVELARRGWDITSYEYRATGIDSYGNDAPGTSTPTASEGTEDEIEETDGARLVAVEAVCSA